MLSVNLGHIFRDVGTGVPEGAMTRTFWQTVQKCNFRIQKCPFQTHNIITFILILITFTVEENFVILFFYYTFEIFYMN